MRAEELRIGNIAIINSRVCEITAQDIDTLKKRENTHWSKKVVSPIPLTEERLLKFGFKKSEDNWYDLGNIGVNFELKRMVYTTHDTEGNEIYNDIPFKEYVHDFQNLVFALENKELEVLNPKN